MNDTSKNPIIEQLIASQINFLEHFFSNSKDINTEILSISDWLSNKKIKDLGTPQPLYDCIKQQIFNNALPQVFLENVIQQLNALATHPLNKNRTVSHIIDVMTVDRLAQYIAEKETTRKALIHFVIHHPAFSTIMAQLVQQAIQQYFEDNLSSKISSMGKVMKVGKSVFENMTDASLEKTIAQHVEKNLLKLSKMSEHVLNKHFTNNRLYHLQAELWHQIKDTPLDTVNRPLSPKNTTELLKIINDFWDAFRKTDYAQEGLNHSINIWYKQNKNHTLKDIFQSLHLDQSFLQDQLLSLFQPIVEQLINEGYIRSRLHILLTKFYYREETLRLLKQI